MTGLWAARAANAERAVHSRHVRRLWGIPAVLLGRPSWPPGPASRLFARWIYWWQAQLLDCAVDAYQREPSGRRRATVRSLIRGLRLRNGTGWLNRYYDDIAWLGLALQRAEPVVGAARIGEAQTVIARRLRNGWDDAAGGGIRWRIGDSYKNVPANGPAAIFFARRGDIEFAEWITNWMLDHLVADTGLVHDGLRVGPDGTASTVETTVYTYCQGTVLGACTELAVATGAQRWTDHIDRLVEAIAAHLATDGVLRGHGGGDGGLFTGILARYLADVTAPNSVTRASRLVFDAADAAWRNRGIVVGGPLFGPEWTVPARNPVGRRAERDLSTQLAGWMLLEAAARLERRG